MILPQATPAASDARGSLGSAPGGSPARPAAAAAAAADRGAAAESERLPPIAGSSKFLSEQAVAASDFLQTSSIRSGFLQREVAFEEMMEPPAPAPVAAASTSTVARKRNPKKYLVAKKMKQKDRIADDYYELLRQVA